ncbi:TetR/AcrR family transcriptional regulator [Cyclobacterium sp.]|uniref:TetR/AcrR family transcriptional regulator n=1 Tax=Cyclobacterium sp. TaxID=1966343 RepID=UPI0019B8D0B1|nr:TetR/AcrR family transcriptional regulator [Cyclobacterium sp.]MBD3631307.1 TetR/AcrR family transcriptional regulator [Cyclobacterium sp.]
MYNSENREKILACTENLFKKYGTRSISLDDIAHHLNMSKKTIYESFADKNDIVCQTITILRKRMEELVEATFDKPANPVERLIKIFICIISMMRETSPSLIHDLQKYHENAWQILKEFRDDFLTSKIKDTVIDGIRKQYINSALDVNFYVTFFLHVAQLSGNEKLFPRTKYSDQTVAINLIDCLVKGIATKKGRRVSKNLKLTPFKA